MHRRNEFTPVGEWLCLRTAHQQTRIVIHPQKIQSNGDTIQVAGLNWRRVQRHMLKEPLGIGSAIDRIEEPAIAKLVSKFHITHRLGSLVDTINWIEDQSDANLRRGRQLGAHSRHSQSVSEQEMMSRVDSCLAISLTWRVYADSVAQIRAAPRLVERNPVRHAVPQPPRHNLCIIGKRICRSAIEPAAFTLQR